MIETKIQKWGLYGEPFHKIYGVLVKDLVPGMWFHTNPDFGYQACRELCRSVTEDEVRHQSYTCGRIHQQHYVPISEIFESVDRVGIEKSMETELAKCSYYRRDRMFEGKPETEMVAFFILNEQPYICVKVLAKRYGSDVSKWQRWLYNMEKIET